MRILVLTTTFPRWEDDSTPHFVFELCKQLQREGLDVIVLAPHHEGARLSEEMDGLRVLRFPYFYPKRHQRLCYEGGVLENVKRSWLAKVQIPFLMIFELFHALRASRREAIDAVHSHWIVPNGLVAAIVASIRGVRHLTTAHAADVLVIDGSSLARPITDLILRRSDFVTADGSHVRQRFLEMASPTLRASAEAKTAVQPMGVNTGDFNTPDGGGIRGKNASSEFVLLFVGRFAEKKGIEYLLEAVALIALGNPQIRLLLAGGGPLEENLREKAKELNIEPHVTFMGWISRNLLPKLYASSDVVVVPSIVTASGDTEGMPTTIVEALAAGKPVVASNVSGIGDVIRDGYNGFLVSQKSAEDIAKRVEMLIGDSDLRREVSRNAAQSSKDYDWSVVGRRYAELITGRTWKT